MRSMYLFFFLLVSAVTASGQVVNDNRMSELKSRAPQDSDEIRARVERLGSLDATALAEELRQLRALHDVNRDHWKIIESARRNDAAAIQAVEARSAKYTLQLWRNQVAYDQRMERLRLREEEQFKAKFNEPYSETSPRISDWRGSEEAKAIQVERAAAGKSHRDTIKALTDEVGKGNVSKEKELDDLQRKVLEDFQVTAKAVNKAQQRLDELTNTAPPSTTEDSQPSAPAAAETTKTDGTPPTETSKIGSATTPPDSPTLSYNDIYDLKFRIRRNPPPPEVVEPDELFEIVVFVSSGKPPIQVSMIGSDGDFRTITMTDLGTHTFPMAFKTGDRQHRIVFRAVDANGVSKSTFHNVRVTKAKAGTTKDPDKKEDAPPKSEPPQTSPPAQPAPLLQPITGAYRANLWCANLIQAPPGVGGYTSPNILHPVPVIIQFDANGQFTGKCDYSAPHTLFNPSHRSSYSAYEWKIQFVFSGNVDWQTGIMTLSLPRIEVGSFYKNDTVRTDWQIVSSGDLQARHTSDPYFDKFLLQLGMVAAQPGMKALDKQEESGHPNVEPASQGKHRFSDTGWYGIPGDHPGLVPATGKIHLHEMKLTSGDQEIVSDRTQDYQKVLASALERKVCSWYLKLGDREISPQDLQQMDLVATTIAPGTIEANRNDQVFAQFIGVFSSDYSKAVDLTSACEWDIPPGLTQVRPGVFQAALPGSYEVRARAKGKSSNWMEGFVTITVK